MVTSFSSVHSPPATQLYRIRKTDSTVEGIVLSPSGWLHETKRKYIILQHLKYMNLISDSLGCSLYILLWIVIYSTCNCFIVTFCNILLALSYHRRALFFLLNSNLLPPLKMHLCDPRHHDSERLEDPEWQKRWLIFNEFEIVFIVKIFISMIIFLNQNITTSFSSSSGLSNFSWSRFKNWRNVVVQFLCGYAGQVK